MSRNAYQAAGNVAGQFSGRVQLGSRLSYIRNIANLFGPDRVVHYPLNEKTGATAIDIVDGINGTYDGFTLNQPGILNVNSAVSDTNTDSIDVKSTALNAAFPRSEGTIMLRFKPESGFWDTTSHKTLFHFYINDFNYIRLQKSNIANRILMLHYANSVFNSFTGYYQYSEGTIHYALTWSVINSNISLYENGYKIAEYSGGLNALSSNNFAHALIANAVVFTTESAQGNYADLLILDRPATSDEVFKSINAAGNVLIEGDSRSLIYKKWTSTLFDTITNKYYGHMTNAVSGSTIANMEARGADVDLQIKSNTLNTLIVWCGVNSSALTAQQMYDDLRSYCIARKNAGWRVILCTEIDGQSAGLITNQWPSKYLALNTLIRDDNSFVNRVADLGADVRLQDATDLTYYLADKVHPNDAGYNVVRSIVAEELD